jgi:hypothetical protein
VLIQELGSEEPDQARRRAETETITRGGVIIEEVGEDSSEDDEEQLGVLELVSRAQLAAALLACAQLSRDERLDAPWASEASDAAAQRALEALAAHAGPAQDSSSGALRAILHASHLCGCS